MMCSNIWLYWLQLFSVITTEAKNILIRNFYRRNEEKVHNILLFYLYTHIGVSCSKLIGLEFLVTVEAKKSCL